MCITYGGALRQNKKKLSYEFSLMIARLAPGEEGLTILTFLVAIE